MQPDGVPRNDSYIEYIGTLPELTNLTLCFRMFIEHIRSWIPIISYATQNSDNEFLIGKCYLFLYVSYCHCRSNYTIQKNV